MNPRNFPTRKAAKRKDAVERQTAYNKLTVYDKIIKLDEKLGAGVGAKRQREKFARELQELQKGK